MSMYARTSETAIGLDNAFCHV